MFPTTIDAAHDSPDPTIDLTACVKSYCENGQGVYDALMEVAFDDSKLALVETEDAALSELPVTVIRWLRTQLCLVRAAPDERTLRNWRSLGYDDGEALFGKGKSVSVPPNWRLYFRLDEGCPLPTFVVVSLVPMQ